MNTSYTITFLTPTVAYARLLRYPNRRECFEFLGEMKKIYDSAYSKVYLLVDFRQGMFTSVEMVRKAARLSSHPQFGASIGFGGNAIKEVIGDVFADNAQQPDDLPREMLPDAATAVAMLEKLCPGALAGVDWRSIIPESALT